MKMGYHYKSRGNLGDAVKRDYPIQQKETPKNTNIHDINSIIFYDDGKPYYEFTNFYENAPILINGISFKTPEHYYQWQKFDDVVVKRRIIDAPTARMASDIAEKHKHLVIPNFNNEDAMLKALRAKFSQYQDLGNLLQSTGNKQLIEHNMYDEYWSDGGDGSGLNIFGKILMKVRSELNNGILDYNRPFKG
ncbi:swarming motility protein YbiA [Tupanvirus deep ocean]|uniref:Swarming motility protein YbiA n=2 Tax=Tupanvirus TaxID=2094720 RepID=A0AC62A8M3_9VIRU|nr:swarming motility protein YbiA [Tupanvirus deep ocean]QKU34120.1 swarming motility protein YbiA [Tupanvirus deep ocean]